jgi:calmodulin
MAWKLTLDEINEYKAAFTLFDKDSDGKISSDELGLLMRGLGKNFSDKELKVITDKIEKNRGGIVELHEFLNLMADNTMKEDQTNLLKAFKYFDRDNMGTIDYQEFKHVLTTVSECLSPEETKALDSLVQVDSSGRFNYKDIIHLLLLNK